MKHIIHMQIWVLLLMLTLEKPYALATITSSYFHSRYRNIDF